MTLAVLSITIPFFLVGAGLMALASQKATTDERRRRWLKFLVYVAIVHIVLGAALLGRPYLVSVVALILATGAVELGRALSRMESPHLLYPAIFAAYGLLAGAFILSIVSLPPRLVVFLYLVVAGFDGFSEVSGRLLGRVKLAITLSPGKTVEGALGGAAGALTVALFARGLAGLTPQLSVMLGAGIALAALLGDLAASWVKRRAGIKDFSGLVPGHGGVLDRFDSFIGAGAIAGLLLSAASARGGG